MLRAVVSDLAELAGPVIISGGTDAGVFALLGDVVHELAFSGPVIGVVRRAGSTVRGVHRWSRTTPTC